MEITIEAMAAAPVMVRASLAKRSSSAANKPCAERASVRHHNDGVRPTGDEELVDLWVIYIYG